MSALPIFPGRFQPSIFGANELNYRVRDGNGWTLTVIDTNYIYSSVFADKSLFSMVTRGRIELPFAA